MKPADELPGYPLVLTLDAAGRPRTARPAPRGSDSNAHALSDRLTGATACLED